MYRDGPAPASPGKRPLWSASSPKASAARKNLFFLIAEPRSGRRRRQNLAVLLADVFKLDRGSHYVSNIDYRRFAGCDAGQKYAKLRHPRLGEKNSETY